MATQAPALRIALAGHLHCTQPNLVDDRSPSSSDVDRSVGAGKRNQVWSLP